MKDVNLSESPKPSGWKVFGALINTIFWWVFTAWLVNKGWSISWVTAVFGVLGLAALIFEVIKLIMHMREEAKHPTL